ncbi:MAG TPA: class I SAM-dependent rRNA methyltransferase [Candidatus Eisenbacteria bacterium]
MTRVTTAPRTGEVLLGEIGWARFKAGHPWIYRGQFKSPAADLAAGTVRIVDPRGKVLGTALYSPASQIALRLLTREETTIDAAWFASRFSAARDYRDRVMEPRSARREFFSESDGIPSLVVDRYGDHLVVQVLSAGLEALEGALFEALGEVYKPASILARNEVSVRKLEGLERGVFQKHGVTPERIEIQEGERTLEVDPWRGQKTGLFLDQFENHAAATQLTRGRVLDAFASTGGFGLAMSGRAREVVALDSSGDSLATAARNVTRNGLDNFKFVEANAFDWLKSADQAGEKFDVIVLDPPAFAKNKAEVEAGVRGYKEINLRAMKMLTPGGVLVSCSCSHHITEELFHDVLAAAAADVRRRFRIIEKRTQGRDHPILVGFPESYYLKCFLLQFLD